MSGSGDDALARRKALLVSRSELERLQIALVVHELRERMTPEPGIRARAAARKSRAVSSEVIAITIRFRASVCATSSGTRANRSVKCVTSSRRLVVMGWPSRLETQTVALLSRMAKRATAVSTVLPAGAKQPAVAGVSRIIVSAGPSMLN